VVWAVLLSVLRTPNVGPYVLFVETIAGATLIAGALAAMDTTCGARAALRVSPARPTEVVIARLSTLAALTVVGAVPVLLASRAMDRLFFALVATGLAALLLLALAVTVAARRGTFLGFLTTAPWPMVPLLAVPLAAAVGLLDGPPWYAIPTTGVLALLRGASPYPAPLLLAYLGVWAAAAVWLAIRATAAPPPSTRDSSTHDRPLTGRWIWARADLRNISRDAMLVPIVASPLLLGLAVRFGYPPLESWLQRTYSLDLTTYRPAIALVAIVLHVPVIAGMVGALLILDERDDGALQVIRVSPLGRHLAGRLGAVTSLTAIGLAVAAPLSGLVPPTAGMAVVLAIPVGPVFTLAVLAVATSRVQGLTSVKAFGIPAYAPLAAFWVTGTASWLLAPLPGYWAVRAWHDPRPAWLVGGVVCVAAWLVLLWPRVRARL
jgi:hypothetical protein